MRSIDWLQLALFVAALALITKPMGLYLMQVLDAKGRTWLDPVLKPLERVTYRLMGTQPEQEQDEDEEDACSEPPPMLKVLNRRSTRAQEHFGQAGFFAWELRSRSSNRWPHLGHSNSYIGMAGPGLSLGCRIGCRMGSDRVLGQDGRVRGRAAVESAVGCGGCAPRRQKRQE